MKQQIKKVIEFNEHTLYAIPADGQWWIAVKPVCEALNVNYNRQFQNIKDDAFLSSAFANQQMQVGEDQPRKWACLPERYLYGWLFSIQSKSEDLMKYKIECYDVLFDHFNGKSEKRQAILKKREAAKATIAKYEQELKDSEAYKKIKAAKKTIDSSKYELTKLDNEIITGQKPIWEDE